MYLRQLTIYNFKNYREASLQLSDKINCFIGDNGAGKTNILDAVYYLSFCKSYFNPLDMQNIRHGEEYFGIHGLYLKNGEKKDKVSCIQQAGQRKSFRINNKEYDRLADHIGLFPLVMVSPYDRDLINEGSELRRKYIDGVISQFDRVYLDDLIHYNKALTQRNSLLRHFAESRFYQREALDAWDRQLCIHGQKIFEKRREFLEVFAPIFQHYFEYISGGREKVTITYDSMLFELDLDALLTSAVEKDLMSRTTTVGIHKDDMVFNIDGFPVKKYGSQGQQKSFVVAIKLAQFEHTRILKGFKPVLLFDDIFDKLDDKRVRQIINLVSENSFGQVFITDTRRQRIEMLFREVQIDHKIFEVSNGEIISENT